MRHSISRLPLWTLVIGFTAAPARGAEAGALRVGAARVDITPAAGAALPMGGYAGRTHGFGGIHDSIYVRAIVLDDGSTQAALVAWEVLFVPDTVWARVSERIAGESGIPRERLLLAAVHDHSAPVLTGGGGRPGPGTDAFT